MQNDKMKLFFQTANTSHNFKVDDLHIILIVPTSAHSCLAYFTADFWQFSGTAVEILLLGGKLGTCHQLQVLQVISLDFLVL